MDHYIDVRLLPDPEFSERVLMKTLFSKLHRMLVQLNAEDIGISFPGYHLKPKTLGPVLRVHGQHSSLSELLKVGWLLGMNDHIAPVSILQAPEAKGHLLVKRKQYKTNADRLRRRRMKRKGETWKQACEAIPNQQTVKADVPFISLHSRSTSQEFCIFIEQISVPEQKPGTFNTYGLSAEATVPSF